MKILKFVILIIVLQNVTILAEGSPKPLSANLQKEYLTQCQEIPEKNNLTVGWHKWEPYQFSRIMPDGRYIITGLDIDIISALGKKIGVKPEFIEGTWPQVQLDIKSGNKDMAAGAMYSKERAEYAYYSVPYRLGEIVLFNLYSLKKQLNFHTINEFLAQIRLLNFRVGITKGTIYGDEMVTNFFNHKNNSDIIISYQNDSELFAALMNKEIDGFIADKIVGSTVVLTNTTTDEIQETPLNIKLPMYLIFSKKTVSPDLVYNFNNAINELITSDEYKKIVKNYTYHILLPQSVDSKWCYIIGLIGSIAFAISGIVIAARENASLFGMFLLAMLPSITGCILLDVIVTISDNQTDNITNMNFVMTPSYVYYVFITVLVGFATIKLLDYYNKQLDEDNFILKLWTNILVISDALGQASFIVVGVAAVIVMKIEPLEFWGPLFAFFTSNVGRIIRDLIRRNAVNCILDEIKPEIAILWGLVFSIILDINSYNPSYRTVTYSMIIVILGAFVTRILVYYFNIPNLMLSPENKKPSDGIDDNNELPIIS